MSTRRVAVFGGTFDPPHIGHLVAANEVRSVCGFDEVILMVANDPYHKSATRQITPAAVRLEMVEAAVEGREGLVAGDTEIRRGGATYSIDTVEALLAENPALSVSLIVGEDAASSLATWHRSDELAQLVDVVVVARPGAGDIAAVAGWRMRRVDVPQLDISSTELRRRVSTREPVAFLIPDAVTSIIDQRGLYGFGS